MTRSSVSLFLVAAMFATPTMASRLSGTSMRAPTVAVPLPQWGHIAPAPGPEYLSTRHAMQDLLFRMPRAPRDGRDLEMFDHVSREFVQGLRPSESNGMASPSRLYAEEAKAQLRAYLVNPSEENAAFFGYLTAEQREHLEGFQGAMSEGLTPTLRVLSQVIQDFQADEGAIGRFFEGGSK